MKSIKKLIALAFVAILIVSLLSGCGKKVEYKAISGFYYSADKGHTYGDGTKEYPVGESIYMKLKFRVQSNQDKVSQVKVVLTIPKVKHVDAKYMDGQIITPKYDAVNKVTKYEFTANASKDAQEAECVFQFIPNDVGSITMNLVFDDNVPSSYDNQSTLVFVKAKD